MGLDLYSKIEQYLDFQDEVKTLHKEFLTILSSKNPQSVIDIGCGQGAFLEQLKINEVNFLGIDLSVEQINICKKKGLNAKAIAIDSVKDKFDCATAIFDVVNYIDKNKLQYFFINVSRVLNQNGYFVFDVNTHFGFDEVAQGALNIDLDDKFIAIDAVFELNELRTNITFFQESKKGSFKKESDFIIQYFHTTKEIKKLLKNANFEVDYIVDISLHSHDKSDKKLFVCKKT